MHNHKRLLCALGLSCVFTAGIPLGMANAAAPGGSTTPPASKECTEICYGYWVCESPWWSIPGWFGDPVDCIFVYKQVCICV